MSVLKFGIQTGLQKYFKFGSTPDQFSPRVWRPIRIEQDRAGGRVELTPVIGDIGETQPEIVEQSKLSLMSGDETAAGKLRRIKEEREAICASMFTTAQYEMWERLRAKCGKPDVPKTLSAPDSLVDLATISGVFQKLSEADSKLDISSSQKNLLKEFEVVVQQGLHRIGERLEGPFPSGDARNDSSDPVGKTKKVFMAHVDRFVLLAMLSLHQAEEVDPSIHREMCP